MAGQGPDRRAILRLLSIAAAASEYPGFSHWVYAQDQVHGTIAAKPRAPKYTAQFFSEPDYRLIERLCEIIIPSDETLGAQEAGVAEFIDFMVWSDPTIQAKFRDGVAWMNANANQVHGRNFVSLDATQQQGLLEPLAYRKFYKPGGEPGQKFFALFREYTLMGFYTTKIGLQQLDYPGFRFYAQSPGCPHHDDPAHANL